MLVLLVTLLKIRLQADLNPSASATLQLAQEAIIVEAVQPSLAIVVNVTLGFQRFQQRHRAFRIKRECLVAPVDIVVISVSATIGANLVQYPIDRKILGFPSNGLNG